MQLLGSKAKDLENTDIFSVFKELKKELDIENLKDALAVDYKVEINKKSLSVVHKIVKNASSGGIMGCAELRED